MKRSLTIKDRKILFFSINLCSHGDRGDFELFPNEELDLDLERLGKTLRQITEILWCKDVAQFLLDGVKITLYREGRVIMEGVTPDSHERAFRILESIFVDSYV